MIFLKKVRLKESCALFKKITPDGVFTHDWAEVADNVHVYLDMEVEVSPQPVLEPEAELEPEVPVVEESVVEEEPEPELKPVKKKRKWKR